MLANIFGGAKKSQKEIDRERSRSMKRAQREMDREVKRIEREEKKCEKDIKKYAKAGQMGPAATAGSSSLSCEDPLMTPS